MQPTFFYLLLLTLPELANRIPLKCIPATRHTDSTKVYVLQTYMQCNLIYKHKQLFIFPMLKGEGRKEEITPKEPRRR